jgi:putative redox protein
MTLHALSHSVGGSLRQEIVVGGRYRLATDEPERLGGTESGPAPHELLPAALASCIGTTVLMYARTKGWPLRDVVVDVEYDHKATPRAFAVQVRLVGPLDADRAARLEKVAESCPLRRALETGFAFDERVEVVREAA